MYRIVKLVGQGLNNTIITGGLVPKGAYDNAVDYAVGDSVDYLGSSYVMHTDAAAGVLPTDTTKWQVLANKGATGATGATGTGFSDGDKGDITISSTATVLTVDNDVVTNAKLANMAANTIKGRITGSTGDPEDITAANVRTIINVEDGADVTDAANVNTAGAVMNTDTSTADMSFVVDEDDMLSNSATKLPTQQSVKAYVDAEITAAGGHDAVTVTDSSEIDFTLTGQDITASIIASSIDETKLDASVNASLDLADSSVQDLTDLSITATSTELNYVGGATSAIQTQLDARVDTTGNETIAGVKTFSSDPLIPDEVYGAGWNGSLEPPTKNAVYDKIETISAGSGISETLAIAYAIAL